MISRNERRFVLGVKSGWLKPEQDGRAKARARVKACNVCKRIESKTIEAQS